MDRMIYIGMTGAKQSMEQQAAIANNMANVSTPGFRAQINHFRAVPVVGEQMQTRAAVISATGGADMRTGPLMQTGRPLDVAIMGEGWLAVQLPEGGEAYTRVGNLQVGPEGQLTTMDSRPLMGEGGPVVVPPGVQVAVGADGSISAGAADGNGMTTVGRLKLVNPDIRDMERRDDGLFHMADGNAMPQAVAGLQLVSGALEGSNVNAVEAMVSMISNARRYEMQMKTLQTAEANAQQADKLLAAG
jgi:flagellar basal-body rod protein FlgF